MGQIWFKQFGMTQSVCEIIRDTLNMSYEWMPYCAKVNV